MLPRGVSPEVPNQSPRRFFTTYFQLEFQWQVKEEKKRKERERLAAIKASHGFHVMASWQAELDEACRSDRNAFPWQCECLAAVVCGMNEVNDLIPKKL